MRSICLMVLATVLLCGAAFGQTTWPDTSLSTATTDTMFVAPANQPVRIDVRNQPNYFKIVTTNQSLNIGRAEWYQILADGNALFKTVLLGADSPGKREDVVISIDMDEATTVWVYAKVDE